MTRGYPSVIPMPDSLTDRRGSATASAERRVRVLQIALNLEAGGLERLVADIVRHIDLEQFENHVLTINYLGRYGRGLENLAELHSAGRLPRWSMLWPGPLMRQIRQIGPDVVHIHSGVWYKASLAARRAGVPRVIYTEHGRHYPDPWHVRLIDRFAARRTDLVVSVSRSLAQQLATTVVPDSTRMRVVPNGVDTTYYRRRRDNGTMRRKLGISAATPIIGSIGRLDRVKGYDIMVRAFAQLRSEWTDGTAPVLIVAGDGAERPHLEALVEAYGLQDAAFLTGWLDTISDLHAAFALFTLSSRSEGTSVSLLEAMSAGLCPVATDVGGTPAVLGDCLKHRLVPAEDPVALAAAWRTALANPTQRLADGRAARERVRQLFALETMIREYERIYLGEC